MDRDLMLSLRCTWEKEGVNKKARIVLSDLRDLQLVFGNKDMSQLLGCVLECYKQLMVYVDSDKIQSLIDKIDDIDIKSELLSNKIKKQEEIMSTYNGNMLQRARVSCGEKIAYRDDIKTEEITKLLNQGYSRASIAKKLKCSRGTIYRRLNNK